VDDLDTVLLHFQQHKYRKAVLFVDNAGADVILGMLPFARQLLKAGTQVGWGGVGWARC
jgi:type II pantothenate kinase